MSNSTRRARIKLYLLFPTLCFLVFAYPPMRLNGWHSTPLAYGVWWSVALGVLAMALLWFSFRGANMRTRFCTVHWLGCAFIVCVLVLLYEFARLVLPLQDAVAARWLPWLGAGISLAAILQAQFIRVRHINLRAANLPQPTRVVQLSDIHIGSRGGGFLARLVKKVNQLQPHAVVITGDLVDSSKVGKAALQSLGTLRAPTLFAIGNHERYANADAVIEILRGLGITTLRQRSVKLCGINFIGIDDAEDAMQVARGLREIPRVDEYTGYTGYTILLYHRPLGWRAARDYGVGLMLCGHTHNGQIFPFNLLVKREFKRIRGLYQRGDAYLYVSPGSGTWGPTMRLGSWNEITCFDLAPAPKN